LNRKMTTLDEGIRKLIESSQFATV
jgi:hypothetical protein